MRQGGFIGPNTGQARGLLQNSSCLLGKHVLHSRHNKHMRQVSVHGLASTQRWGTTFFRPTMRPPLPPTGRGCGVASWAR